MRIALCQIPVSSRPAVNLDRVRAALAEAASQDAELAVFPEATQIRFGCDPRPVAAAVDEGFGADLAQAAADAGGGGRWRGGPAPPGPGRPPTPGWRWSRASSPRLRTDACTTRP